MEFSFRDISPIVLILAVTVALIIGFNLGVEFQRTRDYKLQSMLITQLNDYAQQLVKLNKERNISDPILLGDTIELTQVCSGITGLSYIKVNETWEVNGTCIP